MAPDLAPAAPVSAPQLWSLGHSNRTLEEFVALVRAHELERVVDVRRYPVSRRHPHFARESLALALPRAGVQYLHLVELGGHREASAGSPNLALPAGPFRGYADHMRSSEFQRALAQLVALAKERRTAVMCAEARVVDCHRRLLCDALTVRGVRVVHVQREGACEHALDPAAKWVGGELVYSRGVQKGLFD